MCDAGGSRVYVLTGKVVCDVGGSWVYLQVKLCVMQGVAGCTYR